MFSSVDVQSTEKLSKDVLLNDSSDKKIGEDYRRQLFENDQSINQLNQKDDEDFIEPESFKDGQNQQQNDISVYQQEQSISEKIDKKNLPTSSDNESDYDEYSIENKTKNNYSNISPSQLYKRTQTREQSEIISKINLKYLNSQQTKHNGSQHLISPMHNINGSNMRGSKKSVMFNGNLKNLLGINQNNPSFIDTNCSPGKVPSHKAVRFMFILIIVMKFKNALKEHLMSTNFQKMQERQFQIINDITYFYSSNNKKYSACDHFLEQLKQKTIDKIPVFSPQHITIQIWKLIMLLYILLQVVLVPLKFGFQIVIEDNLLLVLYYIPAIFLFLDLGINFNTAYYYQGIIVNDRDKIIKRYLKFNFWIDLLTAVSLSFQTEVIHSAGLIDLIILLRVMWIPSLAGELAEHFQIAQRFGAFQQLVKLFYLVCMFAHIFGCTFHYLGLYNEDQDSTQSWLKVYELQDKSTIDRYIESVYFAFITATTVGYGDISPQNKVEKIFTIIFTLISCVQFAYTVNIIGTIFQQRLQQKQEYKKQQYQITHYMRQRFIDKTLQIKVLKYLDYLHTVNKYGHEKAERILSQISENLRKDVYIGFYSKVLLQTKFFKLNYSKESLIAASLYMREKTFAPGEVIYKQGDVDSKVYIIRSGNVETFLHKTQDTSSVISKILQQGKCFGYMEFINQQPRSVCTRSVGITSVIYLERHLFANAIYPFKDDYEKFCSMHDKSVFSDLKFGFRCICCRSYKHLVQQCPLVFYQPQKQILAQKHNYSTDHKERKKIDTRKTKENVFHTYKDFTLINKVGRIKIFEQFSYQMELEDSEINYFQQILVEYTSDSQYIKELNKVNKLNTIQTGLDYNSFPMTKFDQDMDYGSYTPSSEGDYYTDENGGDQEEEGGFGHHVGFISQFTHGDYSQKNSSYRTQKTTQSELQKKSTYSKSQLSQYSKYSKQSTEKNKNNKKQNFKYEISSQFEESQSKSPSISESQSQTQKQKKQDNQDEENMSISIEMLNQSSNNINDSMFNTQYEKKGQDTDLETQKNQRLKQISQSLSKSKSILQKNNKSTKQKVIINDQKNNKSQYNSANSTISVKQFTTNNIPDYNLNPHELKSTMKQKNNNNQSIYTGSQSQRKQVKIQQKNNNSNTNVNFNLINSSQELKNVYENQVINGTLILHV